MDRRRHGRYVSEGQVQLQVLAGCGHRAGQRQGDHGDQPFARGVGIGDADASHRGRRPAGHAACAHHGQPAAARRRSAALSGVDAGIGAGTGDEAVSWWTWPGLRGAVLEQIPGRLVDIGAGGCSVEMAARLGAGTFGFVEIEGPDASLAEVARVCEHHRASRRRVAVSRAPRVPADRAAGTRQCRPRAARDGSAGCSRRKGWSQPDSGAPERAHGKHARRASRRKTGRKTRSFRRRRAKDIPWQTT